MKLPEIMKRSTLVVCLGIAILLIISVGDFYDEISGAIISFINSVYYNI